MDDKLQFNSDFFLGPSQNKAEVRHRNSVSRKINDAIMRKGKEEDTKKFEYRIALNFRF